MSSVHFLSESEIAELSRITLLETYLQHKVSTLLQTNVSLHRHAGEETGALINERRLTNIGTFRADVEAYLRASRHQSRPDPYGTLTGADVYRHSAGAAWQKFIKRCWRRFS